MELQSFYLTETMKNGKLFGRLDKNTDYFIKKILTRTHGLQLKFIERKCLFKWHEQRNAWY